VRHARPTPDWRNRFNLLATHGRLQTLIDSVSNAVQSGDPWVAQRAWAKFEAAVLDHVAVEERDLMGEYAPAHPIEAARICEDHEAIRATLGDLGVRVELHTVNEEEVAALGRTLVAHAAYEERTVYQWAITHPPQGADTLRAKLRRKRSTNVRWRGSEPPR
jgi:hypothetical protein